MKTIAQHNRLWLKSVAVIFGLSFLVPWTTAQARIIFKAPDGLGVPGRRVAGGSRSIQQQCLSPNEHLVAIVPKSNIVLTTQAKPVFFFYVPQTSATIEFVVQDNDQQVVLAKQIYKSTSKSGIVSIPLTQTSLEAGKQYRWFFSVICNPKERSQDKVVEGGIRRISPDSQLATKLKNASAKELVNIYAEAGIWQDSLGTLAQQLVSHPNDQGLKTDWKELLTAENVNLDKESTKLLNEPLLPLQQTTDPI
ncbi:DUF928 domain-containing protein [Aetokthonos hydrillicola Thurmond2011]|jgi:hypothetical protein|uniref:DUF928 domain-containing protein n=1 Tax=Aetokthonos hydrillicola Thurmond2011 TaxID=2712845 RepID=A0AAP5MB71_9CYAN|nr:DUF928 domain-containing protein [Aetokthonos hydrillicola]MBO3460379.1 DUF928 domain-containing protein [Aetokthonos hydrillicola CCALA 1050]MBW4584501.1 DUF928 domain-containing protein [Aetokthonos hydrillicola CCALA 1050]MDR9896464.1 DUF928 domain-containing protein [Aetokthonos hydrillicola Thurmond2011]